MAKPVAGQRTGRAPAEGWSSVLLLAIMVALVGWAIDDAHWVLGAASHTDFLPWAGILGVLAGTLGAVLGRGRLVTHGLGAIAATVFLTWVIADVVAPGEEPGGILAAVGERVWAAWDDLVIRGRPTTREIAHFLLALGILVWGTGQFAAYALLAHRRPMAAVVIPGSVLVANVAITAHDQFAVLVLFTLAALLLLVRAHVAEEQRTWARHRIADVGNAVGLSLRAGLTFVAIALVTSLLLTTFVSAAPLAGAWQGIDQRLVDGARELARFFPAAGPTRFGGATFGSTISITGEWIADDSPVLSITSEPTAPKVKWRVVAYDRLTGNQWSRSATIEIPVESGAALLDGTADAPAATVASREVRYEVRGIAGSPGDLVSPGIPLTVDRAARVTLVAAGDESWFGNIRLDGSPVYRATAAVPVLDPEVEGA
jgi:hypothetical protein